MFLFARLIVFLLLFIVAIAPHQWQQTKQKKVNLFCLLLVLLSCDGQTESDSPLSWSAERLGYDYLLHHKVCTFVVVICICMCACPIVACSSLYPSSAVLVISSSQIFANYYQRFVVSQLLTVKWNWNLLLKFIRNQIMKSENCLTQHW